MSNLPMESAFVKEGEVYSYCEFLPVRADGFFDCEIKETQPGILAFFSGTGISSVEKVLGQTIHSYSQLLASSMPKNAVEKWAKNIFCLHLEIKKGNITESKACVLLLPNEEILVYDTMKTPFIKNGSVLGYTERILFSQEDYTPGEVLDLYAKAYGSKKGLGLLGFARKYNFFEYLGDKVEKNPKRLFIIVNDLEKEYLKLRSRNFPYENQTRRAILSEYYRFLKEKHGMTKKDLCEKVMTEHKKKPWKPSSS